MLTVTLDRRQLVVLKVFNSLGHEVTTLMNRSLEAGEHHIEWRPDGLASGVYVCQMQAGGFVQARKIMLLK
jgi:hypothetical protein